MADEYKNGMLDWDAEITDDGKSGGQYIVLPEGDYVFKVAKFERASWKGSDKIPAGTPVASYTLEVDTFDGTATCKVDLQLIKTIEWKISSFFRCIGMKKHGEAVKPDWFGAVGKKGKAHFKPRTWNDGSGKQSNEVDYFCDYDEADYVDSMQKAEDDMPF